MGQINKEEEHNMKANYTLEKALMEHLMDRNMKDSI